MIGQLCGYVTYEEVSPGGPSLLVVGNGVGYEVYTYLVGTGERTLWTHQHVTENAHTLYGFVTFEEREVFRTLIGVSGVGPRSAFALLKALSVAELETAARHADLKRLMAVPGIGRKTAENIVRALKT